MTDVSRAAHDATALRAIAHPIRNRILSEIAAVGPTRAADLARDLGIPANTANTANTASFHLRQLAKYGLIEEAPGAARDRRDRVWRLVNEDGLTIDTGELEKAPGGKAAVAVFRKSARAWAHHVVDVAYSAEKEPETMRSITHQALRLTRDEAVELSADLEKVMQAWQKRTQGRDDARRTYLYTSFLQPYPDETS